MILESILVFRTWAHRDMCDSLAIVGQNNKKYDTIDIVRKRQMQFPRH